MINEDKKKRIVTVARFREAFQEAGPEKYELTLVVGEKGLNRVIGEPTINRPSFALTGYMEHFAFRRIQVLGRAECAYLKSLTPQERQERYTPLFKKAIPCFVFCRGLQPPKDFLEYAEKHNVPVFRSRLITFVFLSRGTQILNNVFHSQKDALHGCMVDVKGVGILIRGDSGIGKSECVVSLLSRGHLLIADDAVTVNTLDGQEIIATSNKVLKGFMEVRGIGIINVEQLFGVGAVSDSKRLDLVIDLVKLEEHIDSMERVGDFMGTTDIMGVKIPRICIPVSGGRDLGLLVEVAVYHYKLITSGRPTGAEQMQEIQFAEMERKMKEDALKKAAQKNSPARVKKTVKAQKAKK